MWKLKIRPRCLAIHSPPAEHAAAHNMRLQGFLFEFRLPLTAARPPAHEPREGNSEEILWMRQRWVRSAVYLVAIR